MRFHKANTSLIGIMVLVAMVILISAVTAFYQTAIEQSRSNLARTAISQARLLEAMAKFDQSYSEDFPEGSMSATLSQINDAFHSVEKIGETGEFILGQKQGANIEFLLISPGEGRPVPDAVPIESEFAEPMRRALTGDAGTIIGPDYDGTTVLAAYQPVSVLDWGIVVKIDLAEIRAPFLRTGSALVLFAMALTLLGSFLFFRVSNTLVRRTEESEQRYKRAVAGTNDGLWDWNVLTGEGYFSPRWAEILEFEVDELKPVAGTFTELIHPDDKVRVQRAMQAHLKNKTPYDVEFRMRKKSGGYVWLQSRGRAVWDEKDQPTRMAGSITDITDRRKTEAALRESEERFRTVFNAIETGTIVISAEGVIQIFNPAAEDIFDYKSDEVVGRNISVLMPEPDRSQHDGYLQHYMDTGEAKIIWVGRQVTGLRKNGEEFPLQLEIGEMKIDNNTCFVGSVADLTKMRSLESQLRQAQKLEAVGQLTGGIAHDFNNLLAVVHGNLSLLAQDLAAGDADSTDDPMDLLRPALDASKRGAELTQRLLAFSRKQALQPRILCLNRLVTGMEDLFRRTLGETIDLKVVLKASGWKAMIDPSQMESALLNLVLNARDAMPNGGRLTIERKNVMLHETYVAAHPGLDIGEYVMLAVSDTGVGMTSEVVDQVFDPFFTTKGVGRGSGLGLSMVHGFVKQSEGHVTIYSEPGEGTSVKLYLPRTLAKEDRITEPEVPSFEGGQETILVVEDEEEVRQLTVRMLRRIGYRTYEAKDGKAALNIIENGDSIDLLLADVVLPGGMNGPQVAKAARAIKPEIKILFMSGYSENAVVHHGRVDEGARLISKPFSPNALATKVREALDTAI